MNEKRQVCALPNVRRNLEYIAVHTDPGRVQMSGMRREDSQAKRSYEEESLFDVMDKIGAVVTFVASMGMMFLVLRIGYGI